MVAIMLGIVEGVTEFIPVSSTGHLIIAGHMLGFVGDHAASFEIAIQLGAILSIVFLYWRRFLGLVPGRSFFRTEADSVMAGWSGLWRITLATVPALLVGFLGRHTIKERLFYPEAVTVALATGGLAILVAEHFLSKRRTNSVETMTTAQAFGIGLFQVLALWPGTSRSAATIVGAMLLGLDRKSAAEFSFLIAVPVIIAATGYELLKVGYDVVARDSSQLAIGLFVSFIVALMTVKGFLSILGRWSLRPFAWYRIAVAPLFYYWTRGLSL